MKTIKKLEKEIEEIQSKYTPYDVPIELGNKVLELKATLTQTNEIIKMISSPEFREKLAELEHQQWEIWSRYVSENNVLPTSLIKKWAKSWKPYYELDEKTKDSDRIWADKIIQELLRKIKGVEE